MSINQKLFLKINKLQGKNKILDIVIDFFAQYFIFVEACVVFFIIGYSWNYFGNVWLAVMMLTLFIALLFSYLTGLLYKHPRPIIKLKQKHINQLFAPLGTWKSFPSDHTIVGLVPFWSLLFLFGPKSLILFFLISGLLIGSSRVYGGVHYPGDILGGIIYSGLACYISVYLLGYLNLFSL
jgi:undecaprenyl-diphosphatase